WRKAMRSLIRREMRVLLVVIISAMLTFIGVLKGWAQQRIEQSNVNQLLAIRLCEQFKDKKLPVELEGICKGGKQAAFALHCTDDQFLCTCTSQVSCSTAKSL